MGNTDNRRKHTEYHQPEVHCDLGELGNDRRVTLSSFRTATERACVPATCSCLPRHRSRQCMS